MSIPKILSYMPNILSATKIGGSPITHFVNGLGHGLLRNATSDSFARTVKGALKTEGNMMERGSQILFGTLGTIAASAGVRTLGLFGIKIPKIFKFLF